MSDTEFLSEWYTIRLKHGTISSISSRHNIARVHSLDLLIIWFRTNWKELSQVVELESFSEYELQMNRTAEGKVGFVFSFDSYFTCSFNISLSINEMMAGYEYSIIGGFDNWKMVKVRFCNLRNLNLLTNDANAVV